MKGEDMRKSTKGTKKQIPLWIIESSTLHLSAMLT